MKRWLIASLFAASGVTAQESSIDRTEGLAAWDRIYAVASHPRCTNCHVGAQEAPMWAGLGYGSARKHGMAVQAGESRIGAETTPCRTCHVTSSKVNDLPHAAPHILDAWRLPPVELGWLSKDSAALCKQMRDPKRNDGNDIEGLIAHLRSSPFVAWGFAPGAGRSAPPGSIMTLVRDIASWGEAGVPCR